MLRKLMKYEFQATGRTFLPLYAALVLVAFLIAVFEQMHKSWGSAMPWLDIAATISSVVYGILFVVIMVMTAVMAFQRFHKNLFTDEGYLTNTLPVKAHTHVTGKLLVSVVWVILSFLVFLLSVFILSVFTLRPESFQTFFAEMGKWLPKVGWENWFFLLELLVILFLSLVSGILAVYMAIAAGNISGRHKVALGIGVFIGAGIVQQLVYGLGFSLGLHYTKGMWEQFSSSSVPTWPFHGLLLGNIAFLLFFSALYYVLTSWIIKKKLNLS